MTTGAADASHFHVTRVIELHVETFQTRKRLQRARLHVRVTDGANGSFRLSELLRVTTGAG